jgi:Tol biopolymer transport system component
LGQAKEIMPRSSFRFRPLRCGCPWQFVPVRLLFVCAALSLAFLTAAAADLPQEPSSGPSADLLLELKHYPHKIVYETNRDGNWELYTANADGSDSVNLTNTPDVDELYPKPSPDGSKICFVADMGQGSARVRDLYLMNADGTGRIKIAANSREPCWSPGGTQIAYMKGEFERFTYSNFATRGLFIYDLKSGKSRQHPNRELNHLSTLNWTPDGRWLIATVHGGMGFSHAIVAIESTGDRVVDLHLEGCRPNVRADGRKICWNHSDFSAGVADLDLTAFLPTAGRIRDVVASNDPVEVYHITWSPDGKYIAFARGPKLRGKSITGMLAEFPGVDAPGWNICVADATRKNRWVNITTDGGSCKLPNWFVGQERAIKAVE